MPPRSPDEVDRWIRDHETDHQREKNERRQEGATLLDAVKAHVDGKLKPLAELPQKVDALVASTSRLSDVNDKQLEMMKETERYRGQREEQERAAKQKKSDDELELERSKVAATTQASADAKALEELKQKNDRLKAWLAAAAAVLVALISAYFAVRK